MTRTLGITLFALSLLAPAVAPAQTGRNAREAVVDHRQIAVDKAQIERDTREVREFEVLVSRLDDARDHRMPARYRQLNDQMRAAMRREVMQARRKVEQAGHELRQSRREAAGERQEAAMTGSPRDAMQAIDDRHDKRDDRRDRNSAAGRLEEMRHVEARCADLQAALRYGTPRAMDRNEDLARQFLDVMRADLSATHRELIEDRGERREDRRERRTDRR